LISTGPDAVAVFAGVTVSGGFGSVPAQANVTAAKIAANWRVRIERLQEVG
jgi:hypothetical protein